MRGQESRACKNKLEIAMKSKSQESPSAVGVQSSQHWSKTVQLPLSNPRQEANTDAPNSCSLQSNPISVKVLINVSVSHFRVSK